MLRKLFIVQLILLISNLPIFAYSEEDLCGLEMLKYGQIYNNDSLASRLNRLETDFFGMSQSGDIDSRIDMLYQMSNTSREMPVMMSDNNYYPGEKKSAIRTFRDNISSYFSDGTMTGFTPSYNTTGYTNMSYGNGFMNFLNNQPQYCPYHNSFHNNSLFHNNNHLFNGPYHNNTVNNYSKYNRPFKAPRIRNYHKGRGINNYGLNPYGTYDSVPTNSYTNISTGTGVRIIKD